MDVAGAAHIPLWTLPVSTQAGLQDAVAVVRTVLLNVAAP
jgi:hypothetical protein